MKLELLKDLKEARYAGSSDIYVVSFYHDIGFEESYGPFTDGQQAMAFAKQASKDVNRANPNTPGLKWDIEGPINSPESFDVSDVIEMIGDEEW